MAPEPSGVEQAVSRSLRDNLEKLQRMADELHQAIADLVSACGSSRPSNALPPLVRAQTAAAALAASLDVLSRLVTAAIQQPPRAAGEEEVVRVVGVQPPAPSPEATPPPRPPTPIPMGRASAEEAQPSEPIVTPQPASIPEFTAPFEPIPAAPEATSSFADFAPFELDSVAGQMAAFDLLSLPAEEQELHRRANRVAKVSMQDIQMLRPEQVLLGREHKDICARLRDDIEKARKEYDRRFGSILGHPVDYFYHWMVEILGGGDPAALGEYPYPTPVLRR